MTIRTGDREVIRKQVVIRRQPGGGLKFNCGEEGCTFARTWSTEAGGVNGVATHLMQAHRKKLVLDTLGGPRKV